MFTLGTGLLLPLPCYSKKIQMRKFTQSCYSGWLLMYEGKMQPWLKPYHCTPFGPYKNQLSHSPPANVQKQEPSRYASLKLLITSKSFFIITDINLSTVSSFKIIFLKWSTYTLIWQYSTKICTLEQRNLASDYQTWS